MRTLLREPLLHFLLIAGFLLVVDSFWSRQRKPLVEIQAASVNAKAVIASQRIGRELSGAERKRLAQEMLEEEILFREAQRRGLVSDNRVRGTLVAMMRAALKPVLPPPSETEIESVRKELSRDSTHLPAQISFEHVSYSQTEAVPSDALTRLQSGESPKLMGEPVRLASPLPMTYRPQIERMMGEAFTSEIFKLPQQQWHGPITSARGIHLVRVIARVEEVPMPMDQVRPILEARWREKREEEAIAREVEKMKNDFRIQMPSDDSGKGGRS